MISLGAFRFCVGEKAISADAFHFCAGEKAISLDTFHFCVEGKVISLDAFRFSAEDLGIPGICPGVLAIENVRSEENCKFRSPDLGEIELNPISRAV